MGAKQLSLDIYQIDEEATRNAVEKYLKQAREYKVTEYIPMEATTTGIISDTPRGYTGRISDSTASIAIRNVDEPERRRQHVERAEKAVSRLGARQQRIIRMRYLDEDDALDFNVANELGYSDRHYRRIKSLAIYRLAAALGLIVFRE